MMVALPTGIVVSGFANEIRKRDFVINWKLVSNVPLFSSLDAAQVAEIVSLLTPMVVPANHAVVRVGEPADSMYFVVSGRLEIELPPEPIWIEEGDFFGEMAIIESRRCGASVVALTECNLLELKADDFRKLRAEHPSIQEAMTRAIAPDRQTRSAVRSETQQVLKSRISRLEDMLPITGCGLTKYSDRRVPIVSRTADAEAPLWRIGQQRPCGNAERTRHLDGRVVDGNHMVHRGDLGKPIFRADERIDFAVAVDGDTETILDSRDFSRDIAILQADKAAAGTFQYRIPIVERGASFVPHNRVAATPANPNQ
jgi:CRP-like cAMP-binding protein